MTNLKQAYAGISDSGDRISLSKKNHKKLFLSLLATLLVVASVVAIVAGVKSKNSDSGNSESGTSLSLSQHSHATIKSACSSTFYPELCFSAIATEPNVTHKVSSHRDVIEVSLNITARAVEHNYFTVKKLIGRHDLTKREKTALHDCLETIDETLDELKEAQKDLQLYPNKKTLYQHADDLKTLISAAITNQVTCLDGFSHEDADKRVRKALEEGQVHVEHMCSNALAMTKNMTDNDIANYESKIKNNSNRKLVEKINNNNNEWPEWISAADRKLLQAATVKPDVVVAADGSGDFKTVSAAVDSAPLKSNKRFIIKIKAGVYRENVEVPKKKTNIMFLGDGRTNTIITASRNVVDGSTTFHSATVAVVGGNFLARDITFQNTAGPSKHQAVALRVGGDLSAFYNCDILAYQDTLYVHNNRQFFVNCLIAGTVDFIFGNSAVVFQDCDIHARRPDSGQKNMVTAQGRVDPNQNTGIVIQKCRIGATQDLEPVKGSFPTYLGRPWKEYSRTVIMQSSISDVIDPVGWHEWNGNFALTTLVYREYQNTGPGAGTSKRVTWKGFKVITDAAEARAFTPGSFIGGSSWLGSTGFPFSLGLGKLLPTPKGYGKVDEVEQQAYQKKTRKRLIIITVSSIVLIAVIIAAVAGIVIHKRNRSSTPSSNSAPQTELTPAASLKAVCDVTQYPNSCFAAISALPESNTTDPELLFKLSLRVAIDELSKLSSFPSKLRANAEHDERFQKAIDVCGSVIGDALDRLNDSVSSLAGASAGKVISPASVTDVETWLSAVLTDQDTCLDALGELNSTAARGALREIGTAMRNSTEFASNSLAIVTRILGLLSKFGSLVHRRRLLGFPTWLGAAERRLMEAKSNDTTPDAVVAKDGSGQFTTIGEALKLVKKKSEERFIVYVKEGLYVENIDLDKNTWNVMIYGDGKTKTVVIGSRNFMDGTPTFETATFAVKGKGFIAKDIGFVNNAGASKHQAVALRSGSDRSVFYRCSFDGFQDTLYAHSNRQFYRECDISGTIDFIFGNAAVVFQNCKIMPRQPLPNQFNTITAQGKKDPNQNTGIIIQKSTITPHDNNLTAPTYLGRPWKDFSTTVIMQSDIGSFLKPVGWISWVPNVDPASTIFYAEYHNSGPGADVSQRVKWAGYKPTLSDSDAVKFTVQSFIQGPEWLPNVAVDFESTL
ncbi:Pectinesterase 3, partial [Mucuna pruriens]